MAEDGGDALLFRTLPTFCGPPHFQPFVGGRRQERFQFIFIARLHNRR
jgi:hypothetical protein